MKNICPICQAKNHKDNFLCGECGFDLDLRITENDFGLPEIEF